MPWWRGRGAPAWAGDRRRSCLAAGHRPAGRGAPRRDGPADPPAPRRLSRRAGRSWPTRPRWRALLTCGVERSALSGATAAAIWGLRPTPAVVARRHDGERRVARRRDPRASRREARGHHAPRSAGDDPRPDHKRPGCPPTRPRARAGINEALVQRLTTHAQLAAALPSRSSRALATEPTLTRSEAEWRLRELVKRAGLPRPMTNVKLGPWEVDVLWRGAAPRGRDGQLRVPLHAGRVRA